MTDRPGAILPTPLEDAVDQAFDAQCALLALGIPLCPSCELLKETLGAIAWSRPQLRVLLATMDRQEDWDARETLLWPRGIHVSRASIPVIVVVRQGSVVATRHGGGPAVSLDGWLTEQGVVAERQLEAGFTDGEDAALAALAGTRASLLAMKAARSAPGA